MFLTSMDFSHCNNSKGEMVMSIKDIIQQENQEFYTAEFLQVKNWMTPNPYCIRLGQTLRAAGEMMEQLKIDSLPVIDDNDQLIGLLTLKKLFSYFLHGKENVKLIHCIKRNVKAVRPTDSILSTTPLPYEQLLVVDECKKVVGILSLRDMMDAYCKLVHRLQQKENTADVLRAILESAYEGIAVVDQYGVLLEFNEAYSRFTGIQRADAIGRHVAEVIDNTHLHITVKTGIPERGVIQNIQGQDMVVHRIPIWNEGKVTGAIGMLIFEGVSEVYKIYETLHKGHVRGKKRQSFSLKQEDSRMTLDQIIGVSEEISKVKRIARKAARTTATVLITGESGTGKEMFAKSIHHLSPYSSGPFISVNCGAIPEPLFESELFGYEEGAFTGAKRGGKQGKLELAHNGTILLDEIGEMPLVMQTKLLRVLQEKEAERVGGVQKYRVNVRIIAATNRDLREMMNEGLFREDLYYRLNVIQLHVPPLRKRRKDIPILLSYYLKKLCEKYQLQEKHVTSAAVSSFIRHDWKGNIREMINTIEQLVTLVEGNIIDVHHLPEMMKEKSTALVTNNDLKDTQAISVIQEAKNIGKQKEKEMIIKVLKEAGGSKKKAAEMLGIHRTTLYQKLKKYNIR